MKPRSPAVSGSSKSLQKALRVLLHLGDRGPEMGITQLARELDLNKATVYRFLSAMQKFELIEKNPVTDRYRLGVRLHDLGCRALEGRTLSGEAHHFLVELSRRCGESASIAVPGAGGIVCLDRVDSPDSIITARTPIGGHFPAHCTAIARVILAHLSTEEVWNVLRRNGMRRFTSRTIDNPNELLRVLDGTRRCGYASEHGELEIGLSGVAAPIFMRGTQVIAAVGVAGPCERFEGPEVERKITMVRDFAARISHALGRRASELPTPAIAPTYDPFFLGETKK
jgi:IclR family transcriptional regulator, KDG regulon repressor